MDEEKPIRVIDVFIDELYLDGLGFGEFGVRIEDHFFVTPTGAEWFTDRSVSIDKPFA
jgi:Xaa-Pro aminopeptidase